MGSTVGICGRSGIGGMEMKGRLIRGKLGDGEKGSL